MSRPKACVRDTVDVPVTSDNEERAPALRYRWIKPFQ
jgi:hypothetical protein